MPLYYEYFGCPVQEHGGPVRVNEGGAADLPPPLSSPSRPKPYPLQASA